MGAPRLVLAAVAVLAIVACGDDRSAGGGQVPPAALEVGDCFDAGGIAGRGEGGVPLVERLACREPHAFELFHTADHPARDGVEYPGAEMLSRYGEPICAVAFETYVGRRYDTRSELRLSVLFPAPERWEQGERRLGCFLHHRRGEPLTGSMEGTQR